MGSADLSDNILLDNLKNSSHEAFDALFQRYWKKCFSIAWRKTGDEQESLDIVQDLFIHIWEKRADLPDDLNLPAYLTKAVRNRVLNWYRHLQNNSQNAQDATPHPISHQELHEEWSTAIDTLPERMREIYLLRHQDELSIAEISQKLNLQPQSVRNQLSHAVQRVRQLLTFLVTIW